MDQEKDDSPESILIKKMVEDAIYTRHHITYEDDEEIKRWKNRLHEQNHTNVSCLRRCPRLPARTQIVLPSFSPDESLPQEARTQVSLEISRFELPKKIRRIQME